MHRHIAIHWAIWLGLSVLLSSGAAQAAPQVAETTGDDPLSRSLGQVQSTATNAVRAFRLAVGSTVGELKNTVARSARLEATPYVAADGRAPTVEQLAFRLTQHGPFDQLIAVESERHHLDPFLLKGLLVNESGLNPSVHGRKQYGLVQGKRRIISGGSVGIAQFSASGIRGVTSIRRMRANWGDAVETFTYEKALDPDKAIPAAAEVLSYYINLYGRDGGVTAYNTGMAGGQLVKRYGFWHARAHGKLNSAGHVKLQGKYFLLNVLRHTNRLRTDAGLPPLPGPDHGRRPAPSERSHERLPTS
jgi:hypothetical protein